MKKIVIPLIIFNSQLLTFNCSDPFWSVNQPGNLWNCKCDWEETDAPIDTKELKADDLAKARSEGGGIHANGLEGNPAVTGEIFTKECTYFKQAQPITGISAIRMVRELNREKYDNLHQLHNTSLGKVLVDHITIKESYSLLQDKGLTRISLLIKKNRSHHTHRRKLAAPMIM